MVQGTIITSYCLQGQLLISHLHFLRVKLIQHTMPGLEWMKVFTLPNGFVYIFLNMEYHFLPHISFVGNK